MLHLWQAVQITIDLAVFWCVRVGLGAPPTYGDAFRRLAAERLLDEHLAADLVRAVGFRNLLVHAYADLELARVHQAATMAPTDLRAFAGALLAAQGLDRVLRAPAVPGERPAGHAAPARDVRP